MINFRKLFAIFISAIVTILLVSCAHESAEMSQAAPVMAEETATVIVTGSRPTGERDQESRLMRRNLSERDSSLEAKAKKTRATNKIASWKPSTQANNNAVIKIGQDEELLPEALDVSVQIDGFRARVVIDGFYTNPHGRNLEGSFKFRLPNGAVPYFFAFGETATSTKSNFSKPIDFAQPKTNTPVLAIENIANDFLSPSRLMKQRQERWLEPKEAIMVSKEKAAFAYNATVAQKVDPALLEWAGAGIFSAKVFPLQAKKTHRVVLGYDFDLREIGNNLFLDLPITDKVIKKRINLLVNKKGAKNVSINRIIKDKLQPEEIISKSNELVTKVIQADDLNGLRVTINRHAHVALVGDDEAGTFMAQRWNIELPNEKSVSKSKAVFLLDTSLSASSEKFHLWVKLVQNILAENETEIKQFAVLTANIDQHWWKKEFTENNERERQRLQSYLDQLILEGATNLSSALNEASSPQWLYNDHGDHNDASSQSTVKNLSGRGKSVDSGNLYDLFLLSDGAITWGEKDPFFISESMKSKMNQLHSVNQIYTYRLGQSGENTEFLNHLAREIGGGSYQLTDNSDLKTLASAHTQIPWKIESLQLDGVKDLLIAGRPKTLYSGQSIVIAGRVDSTIGEELKLTVSKSGKQLTVKIPMDNKIDSSLASRVFGQVAVEQLETIIALERKVASSFANHFRIPGKSSSLLMLESEADYQRYNIKPTEDAFIAGHKQVNRIFEQLEDGFAEALSDPKKRLLQKIDKLEKMTFIKFSMNDAISILIEEMPKEYFAVRKANAPSNSLLSEKITKSRISSAYLKQLKPNDIQYAALEKESERRLKRYTPQDALKVMSSLIEQMPADVPILRDVAFAAESWGLFEQAFQLHLAAASLRPYEPQSYTYLAKLAEKMDRNDLALVYFEIGLASQWAGRFGDYELIHKVDYANFLRKTLTQGSEGDFYSHDYAMLKLNRLSKEINLSGSDLIIAISWNTDRTDIDLHVKEPSGEECSYEHKTTRSGGFITADVTQGYGPEMYVNKTAPKGKYKVYVNYYSSDQNKLGLKTKVLVRSIRNWGTDKETEETQTVSLDTQKDKQLVAKIKI